MCVNITHKSESLILTTEHQKSVEKSNSAVAPTNFLIVYKWNIINEAGLEFWSDHISSSWESIWFQILSHDGLTWSDQNSGPASLIIFHLETFTKSAGEGVK